MDLTGPIKSAENQFKQILEGYFVSVYDEKSLPSHGIEHHRRVWNFAKELISLNNKRDPVMDPSLHNSLIIACYIHDIGMSVDPGPRHGSHSMEFCKRFLHEHKLDENDFPGLLEAIREHDNKDYGKPSTESDLSAILSVSDDLDAFGFTGIYRYLEIYSLRGYELETIGRRIRENAAKRFAHFEKLFGSAEAFTKAQRKRYLILDSFFKSGHQQVIELISEAIRLKKDLYELISDTNSERDPVVKWFFDELKNEDPGLKSGENAGHDLTS